MGKLGKKARKFAKKNLQAVLRQRRKNKAFLFKKKHSSKHDQTNVEGEMGDLMENSNGRIPNIQDIQDMSIDAVFGKDDEFDTLEDVSDSDGYFSEDSSWPQVMDSETGKSLEGEGGVSSLSIQNRKIYEDLAAQKKKLERLKKKDPEFKKFLQSYKGSRILQNEEMDSDEDEIGNQSMLLENKSEPAAETCKLLTTCAINLWGQLAKEENNKAALVCLINAYRTACHYGSESSGHQIQNSETFSSIIIFVLSEVDNIFRKQLQISSSNSKKETVLELKNTSKCQNLKPLIKSYFRSTLILLNHVADSGALTFVLHRIKASLIFFALLPSLLHRFIKTTVHLWATGEGSLAAASFHFIREVAGVFSSDHLESCIAKTFRAFMAQNRISELGNIGHMKFLMNSIVELCSLDVQKSSAKALESVCQLSRILQCGLQTKKKEIIKKICSWEYVSCIDLWVTFISAHVLDYDLPELLFRTIQLINGVAYTFSGPRYLPLRLKCIQWLNNLSTSSRMFIPVASYIMDVLEYKIVKEGGKPGKDVNFSSVVKLPKSCLKSKAFQMECLLSVIEQLSTHFSQWSFHISFPELATIPLIRLRKFHDSTTVDSSQRMVKRLIDQVERNVDFVQRKRDEVAFSPKDHESVESFLQLEKSGSVCPFVQYYQSNLEKAALRSSPKKGKRSLPEQEYPRKKKRKAG